MNKLAEEQGIRAAIAHYADGMRTHNVESLRRAFHEQAILCGYLGDQLIAGPIGELYIFVSSNPALERRVRFDAAADDSGRHFNHGSGVNEGQAY